jgi:hypothetical protein
MSKWFVTSGEPSVSAAERQFAEEEGTQDRKA